MSPGTPHIGASPPRTRLLALAVLLLASVVVGAALAVQSIRTARSHRATAERALTDYAGFGAFILASQAYRQLGGEVVATFASWGGAAERPTLPEAVRCASGNAFLAGPADGSAVRFTGAALAPELTRRLTDTLRAAPQLLEEAGWRFRFVRLAAPPVDGVFISSYQTPAGQWRLRGFTACLGGDDSPFRRLMLSERALPPSVARDVAPDSLFSIVVSAGGSAVYRSPSADSSPYVGAARLGVEFGDMVLQLALRPGVAGRLVIGGVPASRTSLVAGMAVLSALFVVVALFQLRREYHLIAIRSEFVSNVSHELRTPLSQILIFTELLKLGRLRTKAERDRSLDVIDQETRRLIRLVENVLQFSRAERGRRRVAREELQLSEVVGETLDAFRPLADARDVTLRSDVPAGLTVLGDRSALRQILLNLLDNAIKYGPRAQTVSVQAHRLNGKTRILVDDQGPGIPRDDRERVWEGYYRLGREAHSAVAGSGIGLAVVRSLARDLEGTTWIEDGDTGGARFVVELESSTAGDGGAT